MYYNERVCHRQCLGDITACSVPILATNVYLKSIEVQYYNIHHGSQKRKIKYN